MTRPLVTTVAVVALVSLSGCRELDRFTTRDDHFEGTVVAADFVRAGTSAGTRMCMTIDADHLEDGPGVLSTSDGVVDHVPLRPMPQLLNDPLSNFTFGDGHIKNLMYSVHTADGSGDILVVIALLQSNDVEVRLLRGAPEIGASTTVAASDASIAADAAAATTTASDAGAATANGSIFAVFPLSRAPGACSF
jgi:hypothetical protein